MPNFEVTVELKQEVLDPEGRAICQSLSRIGFDSVKNVKVSKRYVIEIEDDRPEVVEKISHECLANPISETFQIKRL